MITQVKAREYFNKKYPDLKIIKTGIYKGSNYIFFAKEDPKKESFDDDLYIVGNDGQVMTYSPAADFENFQNVRWFL